MPQMSQAESLGGRHLCWTVDYLFSQRLRQETKKQRATGRTRDGTTFPLSIVVRPADEMEDGRWIPPGQGRWSVSMAEAFFI